MALVVKKIYETICDKCGITIPEDYLVPVWEWSEDKEYLDREEKDICGRCQTTSFACRHCDAITFEDEVFVYSDYLAEGDCLCPLCAEKLLMKVLPDLNKVKEKVVELLKHY